LKGKHKTPGDVLCCVAGSQTFTIEWMKTG
jgi:hypothetical protein